MLKSTEPPLSDRTDNMSAHDPISLYERLISVKPPGLSENAWAVGAGVNRNIFTDIRRRNNAHPDTIDKLLEHIGLTRFEFDAGVKATEREAPPPAVRAPRMAFQGTDRPRNVPVLGTAECGDIEFAGDDGTVDVESMALDQDDVVDYVRRPLTLDNRRDAYAIYFQGNSMSPRFEDGELAYVDPKRPPSRLDYVVVQLRAPDEVEGERVVRVLAKRLLRNTSTYVELQQFHPELTFRVPKSQIKHMHRIWPWAELVGF